MGLMLSIVSRFRKRATTREVLQGIDEDIKRLESTLERNQKLQKKIVLTLLTFSFILYVIAVAVFYFLLLPDNWSDRAVWILPFAIFPVLIYLLKRCFHFFFVTRTKRIGNELDSLNERKKAILDDVTENETYKVAKELLEKFDPHGEIIKRDFAVMSPPAQKISPQDNQQSELRRRINASISKEINERPLSPRSLPSTPIHDRTIRTPQKMTPIMSPAVGRPPGAGTPNPVPSNGLSSPVSGAVFQGASLRKYPILPRERSTFDKVAEYFVGDGPTYRYALICKFCQGHNGMALKDEFEYIAFRCCYCGAPNAARKPRPNAPPLEESRSSDPESDREKSPNSKTQTHDEDHTNKELNKANEDEAGKENSGTMQDPKGTEEQENVITPD